MSNSSTLLRQTFGTKDGEVVVEEEPQSMARRCAKVGAVSPVNRTLIHRSGTYDDKFDRCMLDATDDL